MSIVYNNPENKDRRRKLRTESSPSEKVLWGRIQNRQIEGLRFRRQFGVGPFIVDFYCPEVNLAIEIDGYSHESEEIWKQDLARQRHIESFGITVARFSNGEVQSNLDTVVEQIAVVAAAIREAKAPTPPSLPLERGGT